MQTGITLLDIRSAAYAYYDEIGIDNAAAQYYMTVKAKKWYEENAYIGSSVDKNADDNVHFNYKGAELMQDFAIKLLRTSGNPLSELLK